MPILEALVKENRYDKLDRIALPCTIVVGTKDATTPPFHTDDLHAGITGSRLEKIEGMGHLLNWESPERIVELIAETATA